MGKPQPTSPNPLGPFPHLVTAQPAAHALAQPRSRARPAPHFPDPTCQRSSLPARRASRSARNALPFSAQPARAAAHNPAAAAILTRTPSLFPAQPSEPLPGPQASAAVRFGPPGAQQPDSLVPRPSSRVVSTPASHARPIADTAVPPGQSRLPPPPRLPPALQQMAAIPAVTPPGLARRNLRTPPIFWPLLLSSPPRPAAPHQNPSRRLSSLRSAEDLRRHGQVTPPRRRGPGTPLLLHDAQALAELHATVRRSRLGLRRRCWTSAAASPSGAVTTRR